MTRLDATRIVVQAAGDAPIVASLGHPPYDLFVARDRHRREGGGIGAGGEAAARLRLHQAALHGRHRKYGIRNCESAIAIPQSAIRNRQSGVRNPQTAMTKRLADFTVSATPPAET